MKKLFLLLGVFASITLMLASCSKSPEQKAKDLAREEIKKHLYFPESYDPADVKIDSAFAPYDSPEFMELTSDLIKLSNEVSEAQEEIKRKKSSISIWTSPYDSFSRNQLNEAKAELAEAQAKEKKAMEQAQKLGNKMKNMMDKKPEFIGFKAVVSYRAKNNKGDVLMDNVFAIFDKNIENIVYMCDNNEYEQYNQAIKEIQEARESDE